LVFMPSTCLIRVLSSICVRPIGVTTIFVAGCTRRRGVVLAGGVSPSRQLLSSSSGNSLF